MKLVFFLTTFIVLVNAQCNVNQSWTSNINGPRLFNVGLVTYSLVGLDDSTESFTVHASFTLIWEDVCMWETAISEQNGNFFLKNQTYGNYQLLPVRSDSFYRPPIFLSNDHSGSKANIEHGLKTSAMVHFPGLSQWSSVADWNAGCRLKRWFFPFDTQICQLNFESYFTNDWVNFTSAMTVQALEFDFVESSSVWSLMETPNATTYTRCDFENLCYSGVSFTFKFQRRWQGYALSIFIPTTALIVLSLAAFALPPRVPDRSLYSITILLAYAMMQATLNLTLPVDQDGETILLSIYLSLQTFISMMISVYTLLIGAVSQYQYHIYTTALNAHPPHHRLTRKIDLFAFLISVVILAVEHGFVLYHLLYNM